jgi:hypothetical protein
MPAFSLSNRSWPFLANVLRARPNIPPTGPCLQLATEAAAHWAQARRLATPHLYRAVLEALQALLGVPVVRTALNEEQQPQPLSQQQREAGEAAGTAQQAQQAHQTAAQALLEALAYQRCSCGMAMMSGEIDTADQLDVLLRQVWSWAGKPVHEY